MGLVVGIDHVSNASGYQVLFARDEHTRYVAPEYANWRAATDLDTAAEKRLRAEIDARLAGTIVMEHKDASHHMGSHWDPFFAGGAEAALRNLPEYVEKGLLQLGFGDGKPAPYSRYAVWPKAAILAWPGRMKGVQTVIELGEHQNQIRSIFPFTCEGIEHTVILNQVIVWAGGVEAQIKCSLGPASLSFFDICFPINRSWYIQGENYQFILTGLAYFARPAEIQEFVIPATSPAARVMREIQAQDGTPIRIDPLQIQTKGMAALLPLSNGDADDYEFRGPVVEVHETEMLGEPAWRVRAILLRGIEGPEDQDFAFEILITQRAWSGEAPPAVGQDIQGGMWLQGRLWMPNNW